MTPKVEFKQTCFVYARVSTEKQAKQNISIPDQLTRCKVFAEMEGLEVIGEFVDAGRSGTDDENRPEFQEMMSRALSPERPVGYILCHSTSRFMRHQAKADLARQALLRNRVSLRSITQNIEDDGGGGTLALSVMGLIDDYQSREQSKHVRRAMEENARQGFRSGGTAPYGYEFVCAEVRGGRKKKKLGIESTEAALVQKVFDWHTSGVGAQTIAKNLNDEGYRTRRGKRWVASAIHNMLSNETYIGKNYFKPTDPLTKEQCPEDQWILVPCPAIISEEQFYGVQKELRERSPKKTAPRLTNSAVLLGGVAYCNCSGRHCPLQLATGTSRTGKNYRYYKCSDKIIRGQCAAKKPISIPEESLDELVIGSIAEDVLQPDRIQSIVEAFAAKGATERGEASNRIAELKRQLSGVKSRISNLFEAIETHGVEGEGARERLADLSKEKRQFEENIALQNAILNDSVKPISVADADKFANRIKEGLLGADKSVLRRYLRHFVSVVIVGEDDIFIGGHNSSLAEAASGIEISTKAGKPMVRGSVQKWLPE